MSALLELGALLSTREGNDVLRDRTTGSCTSWSSAWMPCVLADDTSIIDQYLVGYQSLYGNADAGYALARVPDLDGNGRAECAIGAPDYGDDNEGL